MRKLSNTTLLRNNGGVLSGLQCNAFESLVRVCKVNCSASALHWRPKRRLPLFCSRVVFWVYWWSVACFILFTGPSVIERKFTGPSVIERKFTETFPPIFSSFLGFSKPTFKYNSFHLNYITQQTNVFIASDEIVSAQNTMSHCTPPNKMSLSLSMR